jgi:hypothetical protein
MWKLLSRCEYLEREAIAPIPQMKMIWIVGTAAALLLPEFLAQAGEATLASRIGDTYEITRTQESVQQGSNGSSGSSHDKDTIIERVIGLHTDGLELEYDQPKDISAEERASNWQFPVRLFKPLHGPVQLLNGPELESRVDAWLKAARLTRDACGHWIFTWNAFRIECDPASAVKAVEAFDMNAADLREGASYLDTNARAPGTLAGKAGPGGTIFTTEMPVDPDVVRRARAETDVVTGEIMRKPVTLDVALQKRAKETVSGTISVTFETDTTGAVRRRIKTTKLDIAGPDGQTANETITETLDRRLISKN